MEITWLQFLSFFVLCSRSIPHKRTPPFPSRTHFLLFCASPVFFLLFRPNFHHYYFLPCRVRLGFFGGLPIPGIPESRQSCILVFLRGRKKDCLSGRNITLFTPSTIKSILYRTDLISFDRFFGPKFFPVFFSVFHFSVLLEENVWRQYRAWAYSPP